MVKKQLTKINIRILVLFFIVLLLLGSTLYYLMFVKGKNSSSKKVDNLLSTIPESNAAKKTWSQEVTKTLNSNEYKNFNSKEEEEAYYSKLFDLYIIGEDTKAASELYINEIKPKGILLDAGKLNTIRDYYRSLENYPVVISIIEDQLKKLEEDLNIAETDADKESIQKTITALGQEKKGLEEYVQE